MEVATGGTGDSGGGEGVDQRKQCCRTVSRGKWRCKSEAIPGKTLCQSHGIEYKAFVSREEKRGNFEIMPMLLWKLQLQSLPLSSCTWCCVETNESIRVERSLTSTCPEAYTTRAEVKKKLAVFATSVATTEARNLMSKLNYIFFMVLPIYRVLVLYLAR
ncbi:unnamed protein product [Fraxinus pennsylvanica]|uniref:WRC domain-containing protein n=1 Tax=Fraxinus pennsylvanica TaxID=56036 RepID=A0AAD1Z6M5_9LAMI|nr:unnamed protein product [Fraxinus pennsylvanica]